VGSVCSSIVGVVLSCIVDCSERRSKGWFLKLDCQGCRRPSLHRPLLEVVPMERIRVRGC
jgi:hypothetical protein